MEKHKGRWTRSRMGFSIAGVAFRGICLWSLVLNCLLPFVFFETIILVDLGVLDISCSLACCIEVKLYKFWPLNSVKCIHKPIHQISVCTPLVMTNFNVPGSIISWLFSMENKIMQKFCFVGWVKFKTNDCPSSPHSMCVVIW